ncbi:MAG: tRNA (adenosine(37)-N6)-threonylcarbamoyltransferase complex ATPase subunit type 1 TsaE [Spirochaetales bacterium]|nr:tRNA (adenosine(37)-N6)-threonylcarbamoyltransferase complex ATPase subunit type 1 TsaE [Spirochaetales bacterium]
MTHIISKSTEETQEVGKKLGAILPSGSVIALSGSLGAGKTVLVKGVAQALNINEAIVSPTFTIVQEYDGSMMLHHLDLYRLSGEDEFESMGGEDFLYTKGLTFIEWSEKIESMLPDNTIYIYIDIKEDLSRDITIKGIEL